MSNETVTQKIEALRKQLGKDLVIMGHHYQHASVIQHTDIRGDSLELSRKVADLTAKHIVFCGVYFMAESAALLARKGQIVHLPEFDANCVMSLMSPYPLVDTVLTRLNSGSKKVVPLAYVNTTVGVKSIVGKFGGSVCTSANAKTMMQWARDQGDSVLFLPDKNLGRNTALQLGLTEKDWIEIDIRAKGERVFPEMATTPLIFWPGQCAIHARFLPKHIEAARQKHPDCLIGVHPECSPEVVKLADMAGSTAALIDYAAKAPDGAVLYIGTEYNLVERLAKEHAGRVTVLPLLKSTCSHMARVTETKLYQTLQSIANGKSGRPVQLEADLQDNARLALERMLTACKL